VVRDRTGIGVEIWRGWHRAWGSRPLQALVVAAVLVTGAVWFVIPVPAGAVHAELSRLRSVNEVVILSLTLLAFAAAFFVLSTDLNEAFDSLSERGGSRAFTFAAGRLIAGAGGLAMTAAVLAALIELLDIGGRYKAEELLHVVVVFANAFGVFMLVSVLVAALGRVAGVIAAFAIYSIGADAAYQRGALADGFITPAPILSAEQAVGWLAPRPLVDPLTGIAALDQSIALNQFPVREGHAIWGTDLIQVSGTYDMALYFTYVVVAAVLFYGVCRVRAWRARTRRRPTTWTTPRVVERR
jgi:hypothetical protein